MSDEKLSGQPYWRLAGETCDGLPTHPGGAEIHACTSSNFMLQKAELSAKNL